jgi:uncharacterized protein (DUF983 family)
MKTTVKRKGNLVLNILKEKCPRCGEGNVYEEHTPFFKMPVMHEACPVCGYKFDREPGYFLGAMYISYAIAVFVGIVTFLICRWLFPDMEVFYIPIPILIMFLLIAKKNYKLSRVIYMHMFPW